MTIRYFSYVTLGNLYLLLFPTFNVVLNQLYAHYLLILLTLAYSVTLRRDIYCYTSILPLPFP